MTFRPIDWFAGIPGDLYRVGDDGSVWRWFAGSSAVPDIRPPRWKRLKPRLSSNGRALAVDLSHKGARAAVCVAPLVLRAFRGKAPPGSVIAWYYAPVNVDTSVIGCM